MSITRIMKSATSWANRPKPTPVVYTMGKVATSSISVGLQRARMPSHHIHTLDLQRLMAVSKKALANGTFPAPHICESMAWRNRLFVRPELCLYITLVRDPIARNLSAFFENIENNMGLKAASAKGPKALLKRFVNNYKHDLPINWFDNEFRDQLGIDVYALPFDHARKYTYIEKSNTIIFRVDCEDETVAEVLSDLLGRPLEFTRENDASSKKYSNLYKSVKKVATFPTEFVDHMYDNQFTRHFWTPDEIAEFKAKWTEA